MPATALFHRYLYFSPAVCPNSRSHLVSSKKLFNSGTGPTTKLPGAGPGSVRIGGARQGLQTESKVWEAAPQAPPAPTLADRPLGAGWVGRRRQEAADERRADGSYDSVRPARARGVARGGRGSAAGRGGAGPRAQGSSGRSRLAQPPGSAC